MPVRSRSLASMPSISPRPPFIMSLSRSTSSLYPARIMPPSRMRKGGSSTIAESISPRTSDSSSSSSRIWLSSRLSAPFNTAFILGMAAIVDDTALRSLAEAVLYTTFDISRSMSSTDFSSSPRSPLITVSP